MARDRTAGGRPTTPTPTLVSPRRADFRDHARDTRMAFDAGCRGRGYCGLCDCRARGAQTAADVGGCRCCRLADGRQVSKRIAEAGDGTNGQDQSTLRKKPDHQKNGGCAAGIVVRRAGRKPVIRQEHRRRVGRRRRCLAHPAGVLSQQRRAAAGILGRADGIGPGAGQVPAGKRRFRLALSSARQGVLGQQSRHEPRHSGRLGNRARAWPAGRQ